jgi:hypothetical protein
MNGKRCESKASRHSLTEMGKSTHTLSHKTKTAGEIWIQALQSTKQSYYLHLTACSQVLSKLKFAIYGHAVVLRRCVIYRGLNRKCQEWESRVMIETQLQAVVAYCNVLSRYFFQGVEKKKHETLCQDNKVPSHSANQYPSDTPSSVYMCI